jgi:glycosyltransferase involved in cell wall biosynthesis
MVTPLKPLEAMALGKAVLGSNVGGIRELIEPEDTGLLFDAESIPDFCKTVLRVLSQPQLKSALGEKARRKVAVEKNWTVLAERYEAIYSSATQAVTR